MKDIKEIMSEVELEKVTGGLPVVNASSNESLGENNLLRSFAGKLLKEGYDMDSLETAIRKFSRPDKEYFFRIVAGDDLKRKEVADSSDDDLTNGILGSIKNLF